MPAADNAKGAEPGAPMKMLPGSLCDGSQAPSNRARDPFAGGPAHFAAS